MISNCRERMEGPGGVKRKCRSEVTGLQTPRGLRCGELGSRPGRGGPLDESRCKTLFTCGRDRGDPSPRCDAFRNGSGVFPGVQNATVVTRIGSRRAPSWPSRSLTRKITADEQSAISNRSLLSATCRLPPCSLFLPVSSGPVRPAHGRSLITPVAPVPSLPNPSPRPPESGTEFAP